MGTGPSTASLDAASKAAGQLTAAKGSKQVEKRSDSASSSSISASSCHMEADQELKQHQQPAGRSQLLAAVRDSLFRKPWSHLSASLVTSGIPAATAEQQAAVLAAYREVMQGAKQHFGDLYQMGHMLGSGHYARVHVAKCLQEGTSYAAKVLPKALKKHKARDQLQKVVKEVAMMRLLQDHPTAVQLHQVLQDESNYYLIMEHCSGGELFDHLYKVDHLPEAEAAHYMAQLASFLAHAHARHIIHRDIKPENMLLAAVPEGQPRGPSGWRLKVVDYGCSAFCLPHQHLHEAVGTVCYVAPEVLGHNYGMQSDVWSAGVVLYMLLCGYLPFDGRNNEETLLLVRTGDFEMLPEDWAHVSTAGRALVRQLLSYKPTSRPTPAQLLKHSWVQQSATGSGAEQQAPPADVDVAAMAGAPAAHA